jgi:general secretion pathway protein I
MPPVEAHRSAGFTLIEVLVALAIAGMAIAAIASVFGNGLIGQKVASDAHTALALAEEQLTLAGAKSALHPGTEKGTFAERFAWQTTISVFTDGKDAKTVVQPDGAPLLYRVVVDVDWRAGRHSQKLSLSTLRLSAP